MQTKSYPEPIAGTFIVNKDNKIFLMKSHKWSDMWVVPGGHIELGETIEDALKREVKEETNMDIVNPQFICILESINDTEYHMPRHMILLNYRVEPVSFDIKLNDEGQEYQWFSKEEVFKIPLNKYTKQTLENYSEKIFTLQ